jgi:hypothetical protein
VGSYPTLEHDHTDQIHHETARQSRSALGIGLIIRSISKFKMGEEMLWGGICVFGNCIR